jgi:hypothetical protein
MSTSNKQITAQQSMVKKVFIIQLVLRTLINLLVASYYCDRWVLQQVFILTICHLAVIVYLTYVNSRLMIVLAIIASLLPIIRILPESLFGFYLCLGGNILINQISNRGGN